MIRLFLDVSKVNKKYGTHHVLKDVSFSIEKPEIIALVGPNGSGKTTLLKIITNLLQASNGTVTIMDKSNKDISIFKEVSFMQDNTVLYDYLTGYDHLHFIRDIQHLSNEQVEHTIGLLEIRHYMNKKVKNYSLGMKQHLLIAMAIVNQPKLLILDEPLNGLDPTSVIKIRNILQKINENGSAILLSSHNLLEIDKLTNKILFLKKGEMIQEDISNYLMDSYSISVNETDQLEQLFLQYKISFKRVDDSIQVFCKEQNLHRILELIIQSKTIQLHSIQKIIIGAEDRYQTIFQLEDES